MSSAVGSYHLLQWLTEWHNLLSNHIFFDLRLNVFLFWVNCKCFNCFSHTPFSCPYRRSHDICGCISLWFYFYHYYFYLFTFCFAFGDKFSLDSPYCPGVCDPTASASHVLGLQTCTKPHLTPLVVSQTFSVLDVSDSCRKCRVRYAPRTAFYWNFRFKDESSFYNVSLMIRLGLQAWQKMWQKWCFFSLTSYRGCTLSAWFRVFSFSTGKPLFVLLSILYCLEELPHAWPILKVWGVRLHIFLTFPGKQRAGWGHQHYLEGREGDNGAQDSSAVPCCTKWLITHQE